MAVPGREPSPESVNRNPKVEWTEVEDKPFKGKVPVQLPRSRRMINSLGIPVDIDLAPLTFEWWDTIVRMPHCILWDAAAWNYARTTAIIADSAYSGVAGAWGQLRLRENDMGVTAEARRANRIRYVKNKPAAKTSPAKSAAATVTNIDERRLRNR